MDATLFWAIVKTITASGVILLAVGYARLWLKVTRLETCVEEREKPLTESMDRLAVGINQLNADMKLMFRELGRVEGGK